MDTLYSILAICGAIAVIWILHRGIKNNPEAYSAENLLKSSYTMGLLGLALIAFVAFLVMMLRGS